MQNKDKVKKKNNIKDFYLIMILLMLFIVPVILLFIINFSKNSYLAVEDQSNFQEDETVNPVELLSNVSENKEYILRSKQKYIEHLKSNFTEEEFKKFNNFLKENEIDKKNFDTALLLYVSPFGFYTSTEKDQDAEYCSSLYDFCFFVPKNWIIHPVSINEIIILSPASIVKDGVYDITNDAFSLTIFKECEIIDFDKFVEKKDRSKDYLNSMIKVRKGETVDLGDWEKVLRVDYFKESYNFENSPVGGGDFLANDFFIKYNNSLYLISFQYSSVFEDVYGDDAQDIRNSIIFGGGYCDEYTNNLTNEKIDLFFSPSKKSQYEIDNGEKADTLLEL